MGTVLTSNKGRVIDLLFVLAIDHYLLVLTQSGRIRTYAAGMVLGAVLILLSWLWS